MSTKSKDLKYKKEILVTMVVVGLARAIPQLAVVALGATIIANIYKASKQ